MSLERATTSQPSKWSCSRHLGTLKRQNFLVPCHGKCSLTPSEFSQKTGEKPPITSLFTGLLHWFLSRNMVCWISNREPEPNEMGSPS
jgi:hypothetical protein